MVPIAGGRIDIAIEPDLKGFNTKLEGGLKGALGVAGKIGGAIGLSVGAGMAFQQVIAIGNDYTNTMNTMQAVSQGTAEQMAAVGERAKELGNDIQLPGTSASDAAAAMTELAKGGFSVQQAMDAAKGTLQLAAAAGIDAASAATIQSQALQAFGLDATYAATASDVLANAANASSAEITDIASGLQQSGAVANQFGLSIEDTAATLGVLANAGIAGSDAGTLLKSTLLSLTDTSNPAQGAIEDLGLTVYDAQGQFVGMSALFGQLDEAAASMTPELYQAATATLFGSDAMRLAGIAAEQGQAGYDAMRVAIGKQGSAAEVAAAKTRGLPGALETVTNAAEGMALNIYQLIDGPLEAFARGAAEKLTSVTPKIVDGLSSVGETLSSVGHLLTPVAELAGNVASAFMDLPAPIQAAGVALAAIKLTGTDDKISGWVDGLKEKFAGFREEMEAQQSLAASSASEYDGLGEAISENAEPLSDFAAGLATLEARVPAIGRMGEAYRGVTTRTSAFAAQQRLAGVAAGGLTGQLRLGIAEAARFGGVIGGTATAAVSGLKSAAGAAVGALGGPWMVAIMAATTVISKFSEESRKAQASQDAVRQGASNVAAAQRDMSKAFQESKGNVSDGVLSSVAAQVDAVRTQYSELSETAPGILGKAVAGWDGMAHAIGITRGETEDAALAQTDLAEKAGRVKTSFDELTLTSAEVGNAIAGSDNEFKSLIDSLHETSNGGAEAAAEAQVLRDRFIEAKVTAALLSPGVIDLSGAIDTLADSSSSAEDKTSALLTVLDVITGRTVPLSEAVAKYEETIADVVNSTSGAIDQTKGFGDALLGADGKLNLATENGRALQGTLLDMLKSMAGVAAQGGDVDAMAEKNKETLAALADQYGLTAGQIESVAKVLGLSTKEIKLSIDLSEADTTLKKLAEVQLLLSQFPPNTVKTFEIKDEEAINDLRALGFKVEEVVGKPGVVNVSAPSGLALASLDAVIAKVIETGQQSATPEIKADATSFTFEAEQARQMIAQLDSSRAEPAVGLILDKLKDGKAITIADLQELDRSSASPEVKALVAQAIADLQNVKGSITDLPSSKTVQIEMKTVHTEYWESRGVPSADAPRISGPVPVQPGRSDGGRLPGFEGGGRMPSTGPGTEKVDGIYAVTPEGIPIAKVNRREWIINDKSSDRYDKELAMINAGTFPKLPGFEEGGRIAMDRTKAFLSGEDDKPYGYGEVGSPNWDCSAFVSAAYASLKGFDPYTRWFTTESDFGALGFLPGLGPRGALNIGVHNGGGGMDSHMAGTLDGVPFEAGGNGVQYGEGAAGADDAQFENHYHLPESAFNPPGDGSASSTSTTTTSTVEGGGNDSGTSSSRAEKGPSPQAPGLTTNYTNDELDAQSTERAVSVANTRRNDVYADPSSTADERAEADEALQRAINALADLKSGKTTSKSGPETKSSNVAELFGDAAKAFVTGQINDGLGVVGLDGDFGAVGALINGIANYKSVDQPAPPTFSKEEIATQGPLSPGSPEWLEEVSKGLGLPIFLRDMGGALPHGAAALNMSGEQEWVQTADQRRQYERDQADLAALRANRGGDGATQAAGLDALAAEVRTLASRPTSSYTFNTRDVEENARRVRQIENTRALGAGSRF
ncbi:phage tail tape measure protein [Rhodococcus cerastii]|nr:phage tail tape measure protein [Rhodococcus cerastii]